MNAMLLKAAFSGSRRAIVEGKVFNIKERVKILFG
jgi:hypothetical protein